MTDIVERLRNQIAPDGWLELAEEAATDIEQLRAQHQRIVDHFDMRSEIHTNDADLAATLTEIARRALKLKP